jgi:hypothetical protein
MTAADEKPVRSPFADDSNAYWVEDTTPTAVDGMLVEWERKFANIPANQSEGAAIYAFTYPGIATTTTVSLGTSTGNESLALVSSLECEFTFDVSNPGDYFVGQNIGIYNDNNPSLLGSFEVFYIGGGRWFNFWANNCTVSSVSGSTIKAVFTFGSTASNVRSAVTITTFSMQTSISQRDPFTQNGTSKVSISFTKTNTPEDVSLASKFQPTTSSGSPTNDLTSSTVPTISEYLDLVEAGAYINAEPSQLERWMGNIWKKTTRTIKAI